MKIGLLDIDGRKRVLNHYSQLNLYQIKPEITFHN